MAYTISSGTVLDIASTYGASVNMTAISNAANAVATLATGHGVVVGDFLEITSGWGRLNGRIARVSAVATDNVTLEGINTTSTSQFPAGAGTGTIRRITAWSRLSQIKGISLSGGDIQFADITGIEDVVERKMPAMRSAISLSLEVYDDPSLAWYATVAAASDAATPAGLRMIFPNGSRMAANCYWNLMRVPSVGKNEALTAKIDLSFVADPTRYAS